MDRGETDMSCEDLRDDMVAVLYGEADAETRRRVEEHQARCGPCRDEMTSLRGVRQELAQWTLPLLGGTPLLRPLRRLPLWLAAAAALLLGIGGAFGLSGSEFRHENGQFAFRLGRGPSGEWRQLLADQEARHQKEMAALRASLRAPRDDAALLQRVQELIHESEARQAVLLNASLTDLGERSDAQRRYDLARMSAGLAYLDGRTGERWARTTELMDYVLKVSQQR
jgi:anti-sigma factor RsiW